MNKKSFIVLMLGGPGYTFLKPQLPDNLIEDLTILYEKLIELGVKYRNGQVYLTDLEDMEGRCSRYSS